MKPAPTASSPAPAVAAPHGGHTGAFVVGARASAALPELFITYRAGDGNDVALRTAAARAVPEPAAGALLALLSAGVLSRRGRAVTRSASTR